MLIRSNDKLFVGVTGDVKDTRQRTHAGWGVVLLTGSVHAANATTTPLTLLYPTQDPSGSQ
jgi:hypothetical protein